MRPISDEVSEGVPVSSPVPKPDPGQAGSGQVIAASVTDPDPLSTNPSRGARERLGDRVFRLLSQGSGVLIVVLIAAIGLFLLWRAVPALARNENGWQSYGKWNYAPSGGMAIRWSPQESVSLLANFYLGTDSRGISDRIRFHHDDSILVRYFDDAKGSFLSKAAFSLNTHLGFETGGSVNGQDLPGPGQAHMVGTSLVNRFWFAKDKLAFSLRGEVFSNPTRYLAQYPPPGFATGAGSGEALKMWGLTGTFDIMPTDFITFRFEGSYRRSNLPYFAGRGGTTSPDGFQPIPDAAAGYTPDGDKEQAVVLTAINFRL